MQAFNEMRFLEDEDDGGEKIYFQAWGSFFILEKNKEFEAGQKFYANTEFGEQEKRPVDPTKDEFGSVAIPHQKAFWVLLNKNGVYLLSSRRDALTKFKHFSPFKNLQVPKEGAGVTKDLGQFDEGYCSQLNSIGETMVVCFKSGAEAASFAQQVNTFGVKFSFQQHAQVDFQAQMSPKDSALLSDYPTVNKEGTPVETKLDPNAAPQSKHSYWRLLQSWSSCSVACGGGSSTRQLICIEGSDKLPCQGKSIQTRPCNTQPCTPLQPHETNAEILPMMVKTFRVSQRPQREEPCVIKEADMELVRDDLPGFKKPPRTPVRVVLNNSTLSIFQTDNFADIMFSVTLRELQLMKMEGDVNCFRVFNKRNNQSKGLCAMTLSKESPADQIKSWTKNINMFKSDCANILVSYKSKQVAAAASDPVVKQKQQALDNEKNTQAETTIDPTIEIQESFHGIQGNLVNALNKEMKFEQLVEEEENEKQDSQAKNKQVKLAKMKENEQCMERQERKQNSVERTEIERTGIKDLIANLKGSVKQMIMTQRQKESNKIRVMRKLKAKQEDGDETEMADLRSSMSKSLEKTYSKGDSAKCGIAEEDLVQADMVTYCSVAYKDDVQDYEDCIKKDNFCVYCCLNEFGAENRQDRESCLKVCQDLSESAATSTTWVFDSKK